MHAEGTSPNSSIQAYHRPAVYLEVIQDRFDRINISGGYYEDLFPGGTIEPDTDSSIGHHETTQTIETPTFNEIQAETSEGSTSRLDRRKAIHHDTGSVQQAGNSAIPRIYATVSHAEESVIPTNRPDSMFPGRSRVPDDVKQVITEEHSSSNLLTNSKKRNLPNESEGIDYQSRSPKISNQAQLNSWEPFKETVDSIRRIWSDLDHARSTSQALSK